MCKPASFVVIKADRIRVYWSRKSDTHEDIIREYGLSGYDRCFGGYGLVRVEIVPRCLDYSLPISEWVYSDESCPQNRPDWYIRSDIEHICRKELVQWKKAKLTGWKVKEAFHPVLPLSRQPDTRLDLLPLVKQWNNVCVAASPRPGGAKTIVEKAIGELLGEKTWVGGWGNLPEYVFEATTNKLWNCSPSFEHCLDAVLKKAGFGSARIKAERISPFSMYAYLGGLFPNIHNWDHRLERFGPDPWRPLLKLWYGGYLPMFDGKAWRVYAKTVAPGGKARRVREVFKWTPQPKK